MRVRIDLTCVLLHLVNDLACLLNASKRYQKGISLEEMMTRIEVKLADYQGYLVLFIDEVDNKGTFHDIRKTAITNWFRQGLSEYDVMTLAGHSDFATTHRFYLAVADDLVARAREAITHQVSPRLLKKCCKRNLKGVTRESEIGANWCNE